MLGAPEQLRARWETDDGKERLKKVIQTAKKHEDWAPLLEGFPYVEDVENGRDFRGAYLGEAYLTEAQAYTLEARTAIVH